MGLKGRLFIFLSVLQRASWRGVHSTAIHLCATGFIYTSQTFIKANLMAKKREKERGKNAYENAAAVRGQFSQNKKTTYKKYLTIIYTWSGGSPQRSAVKRTANSSVYAQWWEMELRCTPRRPIPAIKWQNNGPKDWNKWSSVDPAEVNLYLRGRTEKPC